MIFERVSRWDPRAQALVKAQEDELTAKFPDDGDPPVGIPDEQLEPGRGAFLLVVEDGAALACGAVRLITPEVAEVKRMYVAPGARRRGIALKILAELDAIAREVGAREIWVETYPGQVESRRLYESVGFRPIPPWGEFVTSPSSVCYGKRL